MKRLLLAVVCLLVPTWATAQTTVGRTDSVAWDQAAPDLPTAQAYEYLHYDDAATTGTLFPNVLCMAKTPPVAGVFDCSALWPPFTPTTHTIAVTARIANCTVVGQCESLKSTPLAFTFVVVPSTPTNLRTKRGG